MPIFTLTVVEKHYKTHKVEANTIEEAKEKVLDECPPYEDDKDHVTVEVFDTEEGDHE